MKAQQSPIGRNHFRLVVTLASLFCVGAAIGQYRVRQDGRLFDANRQVGSGGVNYSRPVSPFFGGNAAATGNLAGGFSLRSSTSISDPTAFRSRLGSDTLSNFRRDSVGIGFSTRSSQYGQPAYGSGLSYFDPSRTAPTTGYLRSQPNVGTTQIHVLPRTTSTYETPDISPLDLRVDRRLTTKTIDPRLSAPLTTRTPIVTSSIFSLSGQQTALDRRSILDPTSPFDMKIKDKTKEKDAELGDTETSKDYRVGPRDLLAQRRSLGDLLATNRPEKNTGELLTPGTRQIITKTEPEKAEKKTGDVGLKPETNVRIGSDMFTDMQLAVALVKDSNARWYKEMQQQEAADAESEKSAEPAEDGAEFSERLLQTPLASFVGKGKTAFNDEMLKAEALLDIGHYYEAASRYEIATRMNPSNPLAVIGRAHALLGAGSYSAAAEQLVRGLQQYPDIAKFRIDLQTLMGGGDIVDIRRADLKRQLNSKERTKLRFLLGYLEYHGGQPEKGMQNLRKAAEEANPVSIIARYPDLLQQDPMRPTQKPNAEKPLYKRSNTKSDDDLVVPPPIKD